MHKPWCPCPSGRLRPDRTSALSLNTQTRLGGHLVKIVLARFAPSKKAASGEFHRAWSSSEVWERVQIPADQCPRIPAAPLAAERIRLGDALSRQEFFGAFVSAPASVFDAEVLAHMF